MKMSEFNLDDARYIDGKIRDLIYDFSTKPRYIDEFNAVFNDFFGVKNFGVLFVGRNYGTKSAAMDRLNVYKRIDFDAFYDMLDDETAYKLIQAMIGIRSEVERGVIRSNLGEAKERYFAIKEKLSKRFGIKSRSTISSMNAFKASKKLLSEFNDRSYGYDDDFFNYYDYDDSDDFGRGRGRRSSKYDLDDYEEALSDGYRGLEGTSLESFAHEGRNRNKKKKKNKRRSSSFDDLGDDDYDGYEGLLEDEDSDDDDEDDFQTATAETLATLVDTVAALNSEVKKLKNQKPLSMGRVPTDAYKGKKPTMPAKSYEARNSVTADNAEAVYAADAKIGKKIDQILTATNANSEGLTLLASTVSKINSNQKIISETLTDTQAHVNALNATVNEILNDTYGELEADDDDSGGGGMIEILTPKNPTKSEARQGMTVDDLVEQIKNNPELLQYADDTEAEENSDVPITEPLGDEPQEDSGG